MRCALDRYDVVVNVMHETAHPVVLSAQGHICFCVIETLSGVLAGHLFAKCISDGVLAPTCIFRFQTICYTVRAM
jgi:hypothetical protein